MSIIDAQIVWGSWMELLDPGDLAWMLAQMRLHQGGGVFAPERACRLELGRRGGDRKARSDRIDQPVDPMPARDQCLGLLIAALGRVFDRVRRIAIHHHLARRHAKCPRLCGRAERINGGWMRRAVDRSCRDAVAQALVEKAM